MLRILLPAFDQVICSRYQNNPRGYDEKKLAELATKISSEIAAPCAGRITHVATPDQACQSILEQSERDDLICVTGSFFIAAEVRKFFHANSKL